MSAAGATALLRGEKLSRRYGGLQAVADLDIEVGAGEIVGLIGPNGAGKSTTFNLLSGFVKPSGGRIFIDGRDVTGRSPEHISRLGLVRTFQHGSLMKTMSVEENVMVGAVGGMPGAGRAARLERVHETARVVGIQSLMHQIAGSLPHGLQRLVSVAIAFAPRPRVLCLDEPLTGLNQTEVTSVLEVFRSIRRDFGTAILLVEHNMKAVMEVCDRLVVLHHGRLLASGTPQQVRQERAVLEAYLGGAGHDA
jgi:branched-chain amino acid transport system ATP-binding protein